MIVKPAIGFLRTVSDAQLATDTETIVESMTNNSSYPEPSPTLAEITTANNDFIVSLASAANGGTDLTARKNAKRATLTALLRELASYVTVACKGNLAVLLTSGFPIQKPKRTPAGVLPAPETPVLAIGARTGELAAVTAPVAHASTYNWRVALASAPTVPVQEIQKTSARITFKGLTPGQIYVVDVNAVGSEGPSNWSNSAEQMVV